MLAIILWENFEFYRLRTAKNRYFRNRWLAVKAIETQELVFDESKNISRIAGKKCGRKGTNLFLNFPVWKLIVNLSSLIAASLVKICIPARPCILIILV